MDDMTKRAAEHFAGDIYATETTGIVLEEARDDYARCRLDIKPHHRNAMGQVMGGALFTLADFTFAVAANGADLVTPTVTLSGSVEYLRTVKGDSVTAETVCLKSGRGTCVMEVLVRDETGALVTKVTFTGYRMPPRA